MISDLDVTTDGVCVRLPRSLEVLRRFKSQFPCARPGPSVWVWTVPGRNAPKRVERFLAAEADAEKIARRRAAWERSHAEWGEAGR